MLAEWLFAKRIKKIIQSKEIYFLPEFNIFQELEVYFWEKGKGLKGCVNQVIYSKLFARLKRTGEEDNGIQHIKNNIAPEYILETNRFFLKILVEENYLGKNEEQPVTYFYKGNPLGKLLYGIGKILFYTFILGVIVGVVSNILSLWILKIAFNNFE